MKDSDKPRYLTKSLFVRALGCPTKLCYVKKPDRFPDNSIGDEFLEALAEGGFQVGALAQAYFPGGHLVETLNADAAVAETAELLKAENAIVFEAAIRHSSYFIRADILVKNGICLDLIEVKAKSCDGAEEDFLGKRTGRPTSEWKKYLYDVAFQKHVLQDAFPNHIVRAHLMLADKSSKATVDGLNHLFRLDHTGGRTTVRVDHPPTPGDLGDWVLIQRDVDAIVNDLTHDRGCDETMGLPFSDFVELLAANYTKDTPIETPVGAKCKACEFTATPEQEAEGLCSGFKACWKARFGLSEEDFQKPNIFEIWNCRHTQDIIGQGKFLLSDIMGDDVAALKSDDRRPGLSASERQHLQLTKAQSGDPEPFIDRDGLRREFAAYAYPLHFIDFETSAVALPFHAGRRPYEGIAFQFSHHIIEEDGTVRHAGQFLDAAPGVFPNYDFVRALKAQLSQDEGTIFRYAAHENTYLLHIYDQLQEDAATCVSDRDELCDWIRTVTTSKRNPRGDWQGPRTLIDMRELVMGYYYDPFMRGSNSIKAVLPAALRSSEYLREKYGKPIYGAADGLPSLNYRDWTWVRPGPDGEPQDPYKLLPPIDVGLTEEQLSNLEESPHLDNGGAAMVAYARLQFEDVGEHERQATEEALLRYCELDTLAMVMIWEHWRAVSKS